MLGLETQGPRLSAMHEPNPKKNNRKGRSYFDLKTVTTLEKTVTTLGDGAKQRWLGTIVVG